MMPEVLAITEDEGEVGKILHRDFLPFFRKGYLRVGPDSVVLTDNYVNFAEAISNFEVREDDLWVISFPKTGTTWTQEMVWCIANDLDFVGAEQNMSERFPFFELSTNAHFDDLPVPNGQRLPLCVLDSVKYVSQLESPRFIKTHLQWSILPRQIQDGHKKPKIIYVTRNAHDTCLSYYHHSRLLEGYTGNFEDFCTLFMGDSVIFGPFWSHVLSFWSRRHLDNVLFMNFEDMKKDLPRVIRRTAKFLGKVLTEQQVSALANHLSFESMKNNLAVNKEDDVGFGEELLGIKEKGHFMRNGNIGEGKQKMSAEMRERFDIWTKKTLQGTDYLLEDSTGCSFSLLQREMKTNN